MWDLVPLLGIEPEPPALGARSLPTEYQGNLLFFNVSSHSL